MTGLTPKMEAQIDEAFRSGEDRERQRRMQTGETEIELLQAQGEPHVSDQAIQDELSAFSHALHNAGASYRQTAIAFDAVDAHGYPLAEFVIAVIAPPLIGAVGVAAQAWLTGRAGRKLRIKFGDVEAEAPSTEEVEQLLKLAVEYRTRLGKQNTSK